MKQYYYLPLTLFFAICFAQSTNAKSPRDESIKMACMTEAKLSGAKADEQWCQCQNDYYAELLTDDDWRKYTTDYYALLRKNISNESTPANSYARHVKLGNSHCIRCKQKEYAGCLVNDGNTPNSGAYLQLYSSLRDGKFADTPKNLLFKRFYVDFLYGYSAFCGNRIKDYTLRTITSTEWKYQNHIWWEGDTNISQVRVAQEYYPSFIQYEDELSSNMAITYFRDLFEAKKAGRMPWEAAAKVLNSTVNSVVFMKGMLSERCDSADVAAVYKNIYRLNSGMTPFVNPLFEKQRVAREAALSKKYAHIIEATRVSRENSVKIAAEQRKADAAKMKVSMSCNAEYYESAKNATTIRSFVSTDGETYESIEGAWKGEINSATVEIIAWPGYRTGNVLPGMAYIPEHDCLMSVLFSSKSSVRESRNVASLDFTMYSPQWRPKNCESMVKYDRDNEIHFFSARGFITFTPGENAFNYVPSNTKLGALTPQTCDKLDEKFTRSNISNAFYEVLKQYKHPDKRGPQLTDAFLESTR